MAVSWSTRLNVERLNEGLPLIAADPESWDDGFTLNPTVVRLERSEKNDKLIQGVLSKHTLDDPKLTDGVISGVVANAAALKGKLVTISGTFRGWRADGESLACKAGPPVSRSDWAVSDKTGCIYAHGNTGGLNPTRDYGKQITVLGRVMIAKSGLPYLEVRNVQVVGEK